MRTPFSKMFGKLANKIVTWFYFWYFIGGWPTWSTWIMELMPGLTNCMRNLIPTQIHSRFLEFQFHILMDKILSNFG